MGEYARRAALGAGAVAAVAIAVAACGAFAAEPSDATPGGGGGDGGAGSDAPSGADGGGGAGDGGGTSGDGSVGPLCKPSDPFKVPSMIMASDNLESARLGIDGVAYLTTTSGSGTALGTATVAGDVIGARSPLFLGSVEDEQPMLSPSGRSLVFNSRRKVSAAQVGSQPYRKLWIATRPSGSTTWPDAPVTLAVDGVSLTDNNGLQDAWIVGSRIYFVEAPNDAAAHELRSGSFDETAGTVTNVAHEFGVTEIVDHPVVSGDELELFYSQSGTIRHSVRTKVTEKLTPGEVLVVPTMVVTDMKPTWLTPNGCDLYFFATAANSGPTSLYKVSRGP